MTVTYGDFLATKVRRAESLGAEVGAVHRLLHDWQGDIVREAALAGRFAVWADTGLGKTLIQVEWARQVADQAEALIVAPLAVVNQTIAEAARLGVEAVYVRDDAEADTAAWAGRMAVTNYERVAGIDPDRYRAVVLDESSILKSADGKTRSLLIAHFAGVERRLSCTATPAPNEPEELTSQAEFLGVAKRNEMLAGYFINADNGWRLKGHARGPMYRWMASWALAIRRPSDLGDFSDDGYVLPGLEIVPELIPYDYVPEGQLFAVAGATSLGGVGGRAKVRKATLQARCERAAELVAAEPGEAWLMWTGLNDEAKLLADLIPGAVNVHGALSPEDKAKHLLGFATGEIRHLITKPKIAARGLNWQHCARQAFVGLSDSYEDYYQGIRRSLRYGQTRVVRAHVVLSELEAEIAENVRRKEREAARHTAEMVAAMRDANERRSA